MRRLIATVCLCLTCRAVFAAGSPTTRADRILAPIYLRAPIENASVPVTLPDGSIKLFFISRPDGMKMCSIASSDGGVTWGDPKNEFDLPGPGYHAVEVLLTKSGELLAFYHVNRQERPGRRAAIDLFYDGWVSRTRNHLAEWSKPTRAYEGYIGALRGIVQLTSGRIVVPFGAEVPGRGPILPTGGEQLRFVYSDDEGESWTLSPSAISAPCDSEYNNAGFDGACEPSIVQLRDGRVWVLMRTQANYLYETFSSDGIHFEPSKRSRFFSPSAPSYLLRLKDGRLLLFWTNTANPPKLNGQGFYGSRDATHVAISSDDGKTWKGFRELYRDPLANEAPPKRGDRGAAYPSAAETVQGKIVVATGQGEERHRIIVFDPSWVEQTGAEDDFSNGLDQWTVFKWRGAAERGWRDRTVGAQLIADPAAPSDKVLQLRRPDANDPDGAQWNFPAGFAGDVTLRLMMQSGCQGGSIALNDHFFDPTDNTGESKAMFYTRFYADGGYCSGMLEKGRWQEITLQWDTRAQSCQVSLNGKPLMQLPQLEPTRNGVCYLRLRSTAEKVDASGFLVKWVHAEVETPK